MPSTWGGERKPLLWVRVAFASTMISQFLSSHLHPIELLLTLLIACVHTCAYTHAHTHISIKNATQIIGETEIMGTRVMSLPRYQGVTGSKQDPFPWDVLFPNLTCGRRTPFLVAHFESPAKNWCVCVCVRVP